jgi:hypothetical protein
VTVVVVVDRVDAAAELARPVDRGAGGVRRDVDGEVAGQRGVEVRRDVRVRAVHAGVEHADVHPPVTGLPAAGQVGADHLQAPQLVVQRVDAGRRRTASDAGRRSHRRAAVVLLLDRVPLPRCEPAVRHAPDRSGVGRAEHRLRGRHALHETGRRAPYGERTHRRVLPDDRAARGPDGRDRGLPAGAVRDQHRVVVRLCPCRPGGGRGGTADAEREQ